MYVDERFRYHRQVDDGTNKRVMNDFLREQYEESRKIYLENLAYMNRQNDEFAEKNGGVQALSDDNRRIFEGRQNRIIRLVAYHDRAQEYIADLQEWISGLIAENRRLATEAKVEKTGWIKYFPNMTNKNTPESDREYRRHISIQQLQLEKPELF